MKTILLTFSLILICGFAKADDKNQIDMKAFQAFLQQQQQEKASRQSQSTDGLQKSPNLSPDLKRKIQDRLLKSGMIGNEGAHGGDPYSMEFVTLAQILSDTLAKANGDQLARYNVSAKEFAKAVQSVRIITVEKDDAILGGAEVDGINFPEKNTILVNSDRWRELPLLSKAQLVLHEYFGILGVERDNYSVSGHFLDLTQKVTEIVAKEPRYAGLMVNVFYGQCDAIPALTSSEICEQGSQALQQAELCARGQAEAHCHLSGKAQCQFIETTFHAVIDSQIIGARYCRVLTIVK